MYVQPDSQDRPLHFACVGATKQPCWHAPCLPGNLGFLWAMQGSEPRPSAHGGQEEETRCKAPWPWWPSQWSGQDSDCDCPLVVPLKCDREVSWQERRSDLALSWHVLPRVLGGPAGDPALPPQHIPFTCALGMCPDPEPRDAFHRMRGFEGLALSRHVRRAGHTHLGVVQASSHPM